MSWGCMSSDDGGCPSHTTRAPKPAVHSCGNCNLSHKTTTWGWDGVSEQHSMKHSQLKKADAKPQSPHASCSGISRFSRTASKPFPCQQNLFLPAQPCSPLVLRRRWDKNRLSQREQHLKHLSRHTGDFALCYRHRLDFTFPGSSTGLTRRDRKTHVFPLMGEVPLGTAVVTNPLPCPSQLISSPHSKRERAPLPAP